MKKNQKLVLDILKPKSKALGFAKEELEGIAADIADNLNLEEDASEEDINAKITEAVDAAIPFLKTAQKAANRVIQKYKDSNKSNEDEEKDPPVDENPQNIDKDMPSWAKKLVTQNEAIVTQNKALQDMVTKLQTERQTDGRRARLNALLKDTGTFGKSAMRTFDKMKFENDAEFDEYYDGVVEDLTALNQERANAGLGKLGATAAQGSANTTKEDKPEVLSDAQITELADTL